MSLSVYVGCYGSNKTTSNIHEANMLLKELNQRGLFINHKNSENEEIDVPSCFDVIKLDNLYDYSGINNNGKITNYSDYQVISIDNIHLFPDLKRFVKFLLKNDRNIFCSGLDSDYLGNEYVQVSSLLSISTNFVKTKSKCYVCKSQDIDRISCRTGKILFTLVGSKKDEYVSLCLKHHRIHLKKMHHVNPHDPGLPNKNSIMGFFDIGSILESELWFFNKYILCFSNVPVTKERIIFKLRDLETDFTDHTCLVGKDTMSLEELMIYYVRTVESIVKRRWRMNNKTDPVSV